MSRQLAATQLMFEIKHEPEFWLTFDIKHQSGSCWLTTDIRIL